MTIPSPTTAQASFLDLKAPAGPGCRLNGSTMGVSVPGTGWQQSVYIFDPNVARALGIGTLPDRVLTPRERRALSREDVFWGAVP